MTKKKLKSGKSTADYIRKLERAIVKFRDSDGQRQNKIDQLRKESGYES